MRDKIILEKISKEELQLLVFKSSNKTELLREIGINYSNGVLNKKIDKLLYEFKISTDHFDSFKKLKENTKYKIVTKSCPVCLSKFETKLGHRKEKLTCSHSCSNSFFSNLRHSKKSNLKRSNKLKMDSNSKKEFFEFINPFSHLYLDAPKLNKLPLVKPLFTISCMFCGNKHFSTKKATKFCSYSCSTKFRVANGTHKGWASRSKLEPSYPEKYVIKLLNELNLSIEREFKCNKWFIDFADPVRKIGLEIDGKQHEFPERKLSDFNKDTYLKSNGWTIYRIKWKKINKEFREELLSKIKKIFIE